MTIPAGNLDGLRILDLTTEPGHFAGKLLSDLGAEVIKIEPPAGDPARRRGPFVGGRAGPDRSVPWLAFNTGKRSTTLDLDTSSGQQIFTRLCRDADVVVESTGPADPTSLRARGLAYDTLRAANPRIILCSLSPFGQSGPYSTYRASDITAVAMGGNMYPTGNPECAPVRCSLPVAYFHAGIETAVAIVFALWDRERTGDGQALDVSLHEAMVMPDMTMPAQFPLTGNKGRRVGALFRGGQAIFREIWPCRDGHVSFALRGGAARIPGIVRLIDYMNENGMAPDHLKERDWTTYNHNLIPQDEVDRVESAVGAFFRTKTMRELFAAACERNLMLAPANTAREVMASRQLEAREFFVEIDHPALESRLTYPSAIAKTAPAGIGMRRPAPRLGEHNAEVYGNIGLDAERLTELTAEGII